MFSYYSRVIDWGIYFNSETLVTKDILIKPLSPERPKQKSLQAHHNLLAFLYQLIKMQHYFFNASSQLDCVSQIYSALSYK